MSRPDHSPENTPPSVPRPWADCECFCIRGYAGETGKPCGWRGRLSEALAGDPAGWRLCPRCLGATLMTLPGRPDARPRV